jgi:hypothetical protein
MREELQELARLHAAATKGTRQLGLDVYVGAYRGPDAKQKSVARYEKHRDAAFSVAIHNAFPAILERLERAEAERDELREESAYIKQQLEWVEENGDTYTKESLLEFIRRTIHAISHTPAIKEGIAARDAQQRREGAAEAYENARSLRALSIDDDVLLAVEAKRLREGGE